MDAPGGKRALLREILREMDPALLAFSGGVDSSLLLHVAWGELKGKVEAVTLRSPLHHTWEVEEAISKARKLGVPYRLLNCGQLEDPQFVANRSDRCYRCKTKIMSQLLAIAKAGGYAWVMEGSHAGDRPEERPGMRALAELGVRSPLREAGLIKEEIRLWAKELGIPNWDRPPMACLATRIPTGQRITLGKLHRVAQAEDCLRELGFRQFRARYHGKAVRIQVGSDEVGRMMDVGLRRRVIHRMDCIGFRDVWVDLRGYGQPPPNTPLDP